MKHALCNGNIYIKWITGNSIVAKIIALRKVAGKAHVQNNHLFWSEFELEF